GPARVGRAGALPGVGSRAAATRRDVPGHRAGHRQRSLPDDAPARPGATDGNAGTGGSQERRSAGRTRVVRLRLRRVPLSRIGAALLAAVRGIVSVAASRFPWRAAGEGGTVVAAVRRGQGPRRPAAAVGLVLPGGEAVNGAAGMAEPMLEVIDLTKNYGGTLALDHVSFRVEEGEMFGLLGPNGAGKTTLLSIVCGLLSATSGEVRLCGRPLRDS